MDLRLIPFYADNPSEFFPYFRRTLKLSDEDIFRLYFLSFWVTTLSDTPIVKFLEQLPQQVKFDEIKRHTYLITLPFSTIRNLFIDHLDLKFVKSLYIYLTERFSEEFFRGCRAKHSILASQDVKLRFLTTKERAELSPQLKAKHQVFYFEFKGKCDEVVEVLPNLSLFVLIREAGLYLIYTPLSIAEFVLFSTKLKELKGLKERTEEIIQQLKGLIPECFGEF